MVTVAAGPVTGRDLCAPNSRGASCFRQVCAYLDELRLSEPRHDRFITYVTDRPGHDKRYAIDASKLETGLGWRAKETFDTGIKKTVRWYLERSDWWKPIRDYVIGTVRQAA
jgi:dTDP-glucose 4,6-dehydratase